MTGLTSTQESFIKLMTQNEELAQRGFELLLKRNDFHKFFDALEAEGLFAPDRNSGPVPAEDEGYVRIPYWSALDYLTPVAKLAGEKEDVELGNKVMRVVRSVSTWRDSNGAHRENYHTYRKFAEILGLLPPAVVTIQDLELVAIWLTDKFDHGLVGHALDDGPLSVFLASSSPEDWQKAVEILRHCTAIRWRSKRGEAEKEAVTAVDDYWLKLLINRHAKSFGAKIGRQAAQVMLERVREVFRSETHLLFSYIYRPAVDDQFQNHEWRGAENRSVEGLRDILLSWCDHDPEGAKSFVKGLLVDELQIVRRIGIYTVEARWQRLGDLYHEVVGPKLFDSGHLHELYTLLSQNFAVFDEVDKASTIEAISRIEIPEDVSDPERALKRSQQQWLSAIAGRGSAPADQRFAELEADPAVGPLSDHPDFHSYMEMRSGPGPAPYSTEDIIAFAKTGTLVHTLNSFQQKDFWKGPTLEGLISTVETAVRSEPDTFLQSLQEFLKAKRPFQHPVIEGLQHSRIRRRTPSACGNKPRRGQRRSGQND
jgi:hypothetical protein